MTGSSNDAVGEVLFRVEGKLGRITLNRPKALNALSVAMVDAIAARLAAWAADDGIGVVLIDGAGERGLCAGGDVRALYKELSAADATAATAFMAREYRLNAQIAAYPKLYVAFMDGIVMGGGVGVSAHGGLRLVTERSAIAMPETSLGMFPDVGGTYLLGRAPGELGTHVALTARRFGAADAMLLGLADHCVSPGALPDISAALAGVGSSAETGQALRRFYIEPPGGMLERQRAWIDACYAFDSVEAIVAALEEHPDPDARGAASEIRRNSPIALKVTLRALREARRSSGLDACLEREFRMVSAVLANGEFMEGIRATVIEKDGSPRWRPGRLEEVAADRVDRYFAACPTTLGLTA